MTHYSITHVALQSRMMVHYILLILTIAESEKYQKMELYPLLQSQHKDLKMEIQMIHYSFAHVISQSQMMARYLLLTLGIIKSEKYQPMELYPLLQDQYKDIKMET